ncbi:lysozyme g-like isoform X1 [Aquarana catesbeiana]|uniref:lysozyme g-like isoform X1 n=1 Tax=Aquarana catesbeiana TaxID=8400 RepID=UPI003CCA4D42
MSKYGNLNDIPATGASPETGRQDGENISGVIASEKLAKADLQRVNSYKEKIMSVSRKTGMDPAIIAAMMSRESRAGKALDANHEGDHGNAFGLMQIDKRRHTPRGAWNSEEHILQATEILISMFETIKKKFPSWSRSYVMKGVQHTTRVQTTSRVLMQLTEIQLGRTTRMILLHGQSFTKEMDTKDHAVGI